MILSVGGIGMNIRFILLLSLFSFFGNCSSGSNYYKQEVEAWSNAHIGKYTRYIKSDKKYETENERANVIMTIASLQCLIDEDKKISTASQKSLACKCARPEDERNKVEKCMEWAKSI